MFSFPYRFQKVKQGQDMCGATWRTSNRTKVTKTCVRSMWPRPPCLPDCPPPFCLYFITVHVVDNVGVHRAVPVVVAGLRFALFKAKAWPRLPVQFVESRLFLLFLVNFACFRKNRTNFAMTSGWSSLRELFWRKCSFLTASKKMGSTSPVRTSCLRGQLRAMLSRQ
jgi:hypothetical protein